MPYSVYLHIIKLFKKLKEKIDIDRSFKNSFKDLVKQSNVASRPFLLEWDERYPCLLDSTPFTYYDRHYVLHPAWAARVLKETKPEIHHDISSTLQFGAIMSTFIKIKYFDYRPAKLSISNFESNKADLLELPFTNNSISSLSCMHTIEHVGLGRYGDALDYDGDLKAILELIRVLAMNGDLLVVVPIAAKSKIFFNAHRVYNAKEFISYFTDLELKEFSLIPDNGKDGDLVVNPSESLLESQSYACGCFWFKKIKND